MSTLAGLASLADRIDAVLPQTQCRKCKYAGCRPYAEAVACGAADLNQCAPGGEHCIAEIAAILGVPAKRLDPRFGAASVPLIALIEEDHCIGCTLCIKACPVDAIAGAARLMHTVIAAACTGCELCVPPCPVDCIRMVPRVPDDSLERRAAAEDARRRFEGRNRRLERDREGARMRLSARRTALAQQKKKETIARALARARARIESGKPQ